MNPTFRLACDLIAQASVTPDDRQCQQIIRSLLAAAGFECETIRSGEVTNLWARHGTRGPLLVFATPTSCRPAPLKNGRPIRSHLPYGTAAFTDGVRPT